MKRREYDAVVVGAGPNGLAAAIEMARAGRSTLLVEAKDTIGGAARSAQLTLPGFVHDLGAAITPLAIASPFMQSLPLEQFGVKWIRPPVAVAHPMDDGDGAGLEQSVEATAAALGADRNQYGQVFRPLVEDWPKIAATLLGPPRLPRHPVALAKFGALGIWPSTTMARVVFREQTTRALLSGLASHAVLPLENIATAAFALLFGVTGHTTGWPFPAGGMQNLSNAMGRYFESLGGEIVTDMPLTSLADVPPARSVLLDVTPWQLEALGGEELPDRYRRQLRRFRHGPGVFKVDYALSGPIPWQYPGARRAGTVHAGGTLKEVAAAEAIVASGGHPERPFVLLAQQSLFDPTRAPEGQHTAWAYCHVPNGSQVDMADRIEAQIERFAPGFRECVLVRHSMSPSALQRMDANLLGGDVTGGVQDLRQIVARPVLSLNPYATPLEGVFICSASTPPGGGVHGMCGYWAARAALSG